RLTLRLLRTRGPVTAAWLAERYGLALEHAAGALERLAARGLVRQGSYLAEAAGAEVVHSAVLDEIQGRQGHARRVPRPVASAEQFSAFLLRRHHLHPDHRLVGPPGVLAALELLQGEDLPARVWEQDLLPARLESYEREWLGRLGVARGGGGGGVARAGGGPRPGAGRGAGRGGGAPGREGSAARDGRADQERVPALAAPRRLVRARPGAGDRARDTRGARGALGALLGRDGHPGHVQRDRGRHGAAAPRARRRPAAPSAPWAGPRRAAAAAGDRALERARRRRAALARGARGSPRAAPAGPLRRGRARARAGRLGDDAPHVAEHGVRRRSRTRLLRRRALGRAVRARRGAHR